MIAGALRGLGLAAVAALYAPTIPGAESAPAEAATVAGRWAACGGILGGLLIMLGFTVWLIWSGGLGAALLEFFRGDGDGVRRIEPLAAVVVAGPAQARPDAYACLAKAAGGNGMGFDRDSGEESAQEAGCRSDRRPGSGRLDIPRVAAWGCVLAIVAFAVLVALAGQPRSRPSPEAHAVGNMRAYCGAQIMFRRNDYDGDGELEYATPPRLLHSQPDGTGQPVQLIDEALAAASEPGGEAKRGYLFREMRTIAGRSIDWKSDFALCATPAVYGRTGYRTFIVRTDGTVWGRDLGSAQFVEDFPADPSAAGWAVAE